MRKATLWVAIFGVLLLSLMAMPPVFANTGGDTYHFQQTITFDKGDLSFRTLKGYDIVEMKDCISTGEAGKPMLPSKEIKIALPEGMAVTGVKVISSQKTTIEGHFSIFPAQPPRHLNNPASDADFVQPIKDVYSSSNPYPGKLTDYIRETDLAGQGMAVLRINPVEYIPAEGELSLYTSITIEIEGTGGYQCGDYLPTNVSESDKEHYRNMAKEMVINPEDVSLVSRIPMTSGVAPGDYDYVIITSSTYESNFQSLADWKTKKGVKATIVTTTWIYNSGGYSGSNADKIRAFVNDAHSTWGATYFLLGGDTGVVPYGTTTYIGDAIPNDTYYGDFDSDFTCEVNVGRASVTSSSQISTFIDKIMTYEKTPPMTSYAKKAALFGFDLDGYTDGEDCKIYIDNNYIPSGWTMSNVYDSDGGNHKSAVVSAVNSGQNLLNHIDHADWDFMGTGYINHNWGLYNSDVDAFYNGDKQGIFYSIGCWSDAYDYSACIAEHYVRDSNGGGVAFVGNSRYGWYNSGNTNSLSMSFDRYFFRSLFQQSHYILGDCFSDHKNDASTYDDYYKYIFTELTLMGDPELPIWTEDPQNMSVSHPSSLPTGYSSFTVHVETTSGSAISGALVCLWKGDEVYLTGTTGSSGDVTLNPSPTTTGTMYVTATKHNYIPYEGEATVGGGGSNDVSIEVIPESDPLYVFPGHNFTYTGILTNNTDEATLTDVWTMVVVPGMGFYGPLDVYQNILLAPNQTMTYEDISVHVPGGAPSGLYDYIAYCGDYDTSIMDSSYFEFIVLQGATPNDEGVDNWYSSGWFDDNSGDIPSDYALSASYPNPFNAETNISFDLPASGNVSLDVYNIMGRKVATLINGYVSAGTHTVSWNASSYSSGVYYYKLKTDNFTAVKKMTLLK